MKRMFPWFLIAAAGSAPLSAQAWRKPDEKWKKSDAREVLASSPWARRAVVEAEAPGRHKERKVIVRWESARPVKLALRKLGITPTVSDDDFSYAIALVGIDPHWYEAEDLNSRLLQMASLRYGDGDSVAPANARVVRQDNGAPLVLFLFPRRSDIATPGVFRWPFGIGMHSKDFDFSAQLGNIRIRSKFAVRDMLCLHKLEL